MKQALRQILQELNQGDAFSIVSFNTKAHTLASFRHSAMAVKKAIKVIDELQAEGSTNIDEGLKVGPAIVVFSARRSISITDTIAVTTIQTPQCLVYRLTTTTKHQLIWPGENTELTKLMDTFIDKYIVYF